MTTKTIKNISIELDGDKVRTLSEESAIESIFQSGEINRKRATNVEWDNYIKCWRVIDATTNCVVAQGFKNRKDALDWEEKNYSPGTKLWNQLVNNE